MAAFTAALKLATPTTLDIDQAVAWVKDHKNTIPTCVFAVVTFVATLRSELEKAKQKASHLLAFVREQLGFTPKSERGTTQAQEAVVAKLEKKGAKTVEERIALLKERRRKLSKQIRRYEDRLGKVRKKRQKKPTAKKIATSELLPLEKESFVSSEERLFSGNIGKLTHDPKKIVINRIENFDNLRGLHNGFDNRKRYEYGVSTKEINLKVETVTDIKTGKSVTASTDEIGPPNSQATWTAIVNTIICVIGYAIPLNRLATMLTPSCPYFTSSRLCSFLDYAGELFSVIYTHLGEGISDADWLMGDDTKTRVIEISQALATNGAIKEVDDESLIGRIASTFGRIFAKKRGTGNKKQLNVSVVIGKTEASDPRSFVFFFRTHLGTLGDLLSKIIEMRNPKKKLLTILSDMSSNNRVTPLLYKKFQITHAGCGAHARRPFWRHKQKDEDLCYWMLSAFLILEQIEDRLDDLGRTRERIMRYRGRYAKKIWEAIKKRCASVMAGEKIYGDYWPKSSHIYQACAYIIKYYHELTRYLDDPRLSSTNNLSERVLRWDKIMQDTSKFRMSERGRLNVDILRTIVHTCSAAKVDLRDYLIFVFKNRKNVEADPASFTPYAFAKQQASPLPS